MKKTKILGMLMLSILLSACEFKQSVNNDLTTGAYSRGDGLACAEVAIKINGEIENRNEFIHGEKVNFIFNNITGFTKENEKVFPGLSMFIVKNETDTVLSHPDLFADLDDGTDISPLQLQAHFVSALLDQNEDNYNVFIKIWDKKGDGTFTYEMPFSTQENELLTIRSKDIEYSSIYLWDDTEKLVVVNKNVDIEDTLILILEGIDGLEIIDGNVYPKVSIELFDNKENLVLSNSNVLKNYEDVGIEYESFKNGQVPVTITFSKGELNNPFRLIASLTDLNSDRKIDIEAELQIE